MAAGDPLKSGTIDGLRAGLAGLRVQLRVAQEKDPRLSPIIAALRKQPPSSYLSEPRGPESRRTNARALEYRLASDGVLVAKEDGKLLSDRPVIPDQPYADSKIKTTWKHVILGAAHNTLTGAHRRAEEMFEGLNELVAWWPPEDLLKACKEWRSRCKICASIHGRPTAEPRFQAVKSCRPFYRVQIDFMEVKPEGEDGEKYIFTVICIATRYLFLRAAKNRMAPYLALLLLDIFLDMGVIPAVCQSDNEFTSLAFEEMCSLLGCTQLFSTALRPQSQGIVERSHRDIRAALATVVEAYIRACPRKWPQYLRYLESKLRHKSLPTGDTPYSAIHGFKGSTSLSSALGAIEAIPEDVVHSDWLDLVVSECKDIGARLTDHWAREAEIRARKHGEKKPEPCIREGQFVLSQKPFYPPPV